MLLPPYRGIIVKYSLSLTKTNKNVLKRTQKGINDVLMKSNAISRNLRLNNKKSINIVFHFDMIRVLRVFLRENDKLFEMIFFAKTRFKNDKKIIIILRLTRGLEIYCHIE